MKEIKDLKKDLDTELDFEFKYQYTEYKNDFHVRTFFEKLFGRSLKKAYVSHPEHRLTPKKNFLDWGAQNIILVRDDGNLIVMSNSEWADFELVKK